MPSILNASPRERAHPESIVVHVSLRIPETIIQITAVFEQGHEPETRVFEIENELVNHPNLWEILDYKVGVEILEYHIL